jgi:hypothetical protein
VEEVEVQEGPDLRDAFGVIGATFRELDWKTLIFFERAVPISPNAPWYRDPRCHFSPSHPGGCPLLVWPLHAPGLLLAFFQRLA